MTEDVKLGIVAASIVLGAATVSGLVYHFIKDVMETLKPEQQTKRLPIEESIGHSHMPESIYDGDSSCRCTAAPSAGYPKDLTEEAQQIIVGHMHSGPHAYQNHPREHVGYIYKKKRKVKAKKKKVNLPKKGAGRKLAARLKKLGEQK